ncbi:uncharacterized protein TRIVIDRAFT_232533 [Trichoderma virens Gv29-8]|uniref:Uncharacterized protein n=1 Tax=Hypocrea virens (strain Gv29-8 / FGSC 10586) TaxID=413071 RepID=G9NC51_HYPVG|nr:uncharacterized protein TRIVIDRAFT_232533 [Trichoderma virens Gv29-8]EHK15276.1 hypothetical protein TRIVIDRAFT_232533 [Trichoderma virens Gv29-8]UKZ51220.1 hypothetical protein TrVGV298_004977 [Trichoderma virens]
MDSMASMVDRKAAASDFVPPPTTNMPTHREVRAPSDPVAERKVRQAIEDAASRNTQLLGELEATAHAPGLFGNNQVKIEHVDKRLADLEPEVEKAIATANSQLKSHKSYRDSVAKKFVYTVLNKKSAFEDKAMREEKAYHEVLEKRHKVEAKLNDLKADKAALTVEMKDLQELVNRHGAAHKEIDDLYSRIFDGPTAGFADEDEQEESHKLAKLALQERTEALKAAVRGVRSAQAVKVAIERALFEKQRAVFENHSDIFSQRGVHTILKRCVAYINRGLELCTDAIEAIQEPPGPDLIQAKNALAQLFVSARAAAQERFTSKSQNTELLERLGATLAKALDAQKQYVEAMKTVSASRRESIRRTARALEDERRGLQQIRQSAFETTVGFGAAAPAYHECCDRAPGFEQDSNEQSASISEPEVLEIPEDAEPPPDYMYSEDGQAPKAAEAEPGSSSQSHGSPYGGEATHSNPRGLQEVT